MLKNNLPFTIVFFISFLPFSYLLFLALSWWSIIIFALVFFIVFIAADLIKVGLNELYLASPFFITALFVSHNLINGNNWNNNAILLCVPFGGLSIAIFLQADTRPWLAVVLSGSVWVIVTPLYFLVPTPKIVFFNSDDSILLFFYCVCIWVMLSINWLLSYYSKTYLER